MQGKAIFHDVLQTYGQDWIRFDKNKKIIKHSLCSFEKKKTQDSFTIFPDFISILLTFSGLENGWAMQDFSKNSRLCMNPYL